MKYYQVKNIFKVQTDLGGIFPDEYEIAEGNRYDLSVVVNKNLVSNKVVGSEVMPGIFVSRPDSKVTAVIKIFGKKVRIDTKFKHASIEVQFSPGYLWISRYVLKMPVSGFFPMEHYLKLLTQVTLLKKGFSYVIAGGVVDGESALLFSSFGGMGKTTLWQELLKSNPKMKYLGDDTLISDGRTVYGYPKQVRARKFGSVFLGVESHENPSKLVGNKFISEKRPDRFVFLERGKTDIKKISANEAYVKLRSINRKIMPLFAERTIMAAEYAGFINSPNLIKTEGDILEKLVKQTQSFLVSSSNVDKTLSMLKKI